MADLSTDKTPDGPFLSVDEYVNAKSLAGDNSDGIDGIPGIGLKTAVKMLRLYGSVEELYAAVDAGKATKDKTATKLGAPEHRAIFCRNRKLIDWRLSPPLPDTAFIVSGLQDIPEASAILKEYDLRRVHSELNSFTLSNEDKRPVISALEAALTPASLPPFANRTTTTPE